MHQTATLDDGSMVDVTLDQVADAYGSGQYPATITTHGLPGAVWSGVIVVVGPANFVHFVPAERVSA